MMGGGGGGAELPPQPAIATPTRKNTAAMPQSWHLARLRARRASVTISNAKSPAIVIGIQMRTRGLKKKGGRIALAVVVTLTVALAVALEVKSMTFELSVLPVAIEQFAFGAFVEQDRKTRPLPVVSPIVSVLLFAVVAPAFTVMDGGFPIVGACTGAA